MPTEENMSDFPLLTTKQVGEMLGLHPGHIRSERVAGTLNIPFVKLGKAAVRYRRSDVLAFIQASVITSAAEYRAAKASINQLKEK